MLSWVSKLSSAAAGSAAVPSSGKRNCKTGAAPALLVNISLAGQISAQWWRARGGGKCQTGRSETERGPG